MTPQTRVDNHGIRYYDPEVGRYISRDPIGFGDGMNVYLYVHSNPINHIDPMGLAENQLQGPNGKSYDLNNRTGLYTVPVKSSPTSGDIGKIATTFLLAPAAIVAVVIAQETAPLWGRRHL